MAGYIPDDIVQRIKNETDIVSVISEFVALKKSGKDFKGLCPFHQEKTPSFFVIPAKEMYYCFGCQKGGNVVNFIMDYERMEYPEALRYLAKKAGIEIPVIKGPKTDFEEIYNSLTMAKTFYHQQLLDKKIGNKALKYLNSRGIPDEIIKAFGIGYAPDSWDGLLNYAQARDTKGSTLEKAGLVSKKQGLYDRFRNRIIIPINNISGKPVAFGARVMPGEEGPKYINSPETSVYKKGKLLFGFDLTKNYIRDKGEAIIVEGYFDLISLYQKDIKNVVAVSGTGFTSDQAILLKRFCDNVALLYDSDSAGVKAAFRACGVLYNAGVEPKILRLPKGNDPDTYIRKHGAEKLTELIKNSEDVVDFVFNSLAGKFDDQPLSRQQRIINALSETVSQIENDLLRNLLIKKISKKFGISESSFDIKPEKTVAKHREVKRKSSFKDQFEKSFIGLILSHPELYSKSREIVNIDLFTESENAEIYNEIDKLRRSGQEITISNLFDRINKNGLRSRLSEIVYNFSDPVDWEEAYITYIDKFKSISNKRKLEELKQLIGEAERQSDLDKIESLTREFQNLKSKVEANGT
jgi:DNA primase